MTHTSLFKCWGGTTTEALVACRDELVAKQIEGVEDVLVDIEAELSFRRGDDV